MFRVQSLAICCLTFGMFMTMETSQADAGGLCFSGGRYSASYFHDYHNYGARYNNRSYGTYYGNYGARPFRGHGYAAQYGGWSTYAPYAYTPSTQYVSYGSRYARGCNTCSTGIGYSTNSCGSQSCGTASCAPVSCAPQTTCAPTCCSATVFRGSSCFSNGCGGRRRGLLGPLCPLRRSPGGCGTCGSFGYSSCGW